MHPALLLTCAIWVSQAPAEGGQEVAARIDQFAAAHWKEAAITPAEPATDVEFLRRVTLDLVGRVPTSGEQAAFVADGSADKRARAVERLMDEPEFAHHFGAVLDEIIQGKHAGDGAFVDYLRRAVGEGRPWDAIFREIMLGPWEADRKPADTFLRKRLRSIDDLTTDTTVAFFGINISCAKCHDHPLVPDWKQRHYYGMASFLHRTTEDRQSKKLSEKTSGDVQFVDTKGGRHTAPIMFLTGTVIDPTKPVIKPPDEKSPAEKKTDKTDAPEKKPDAAKPDPAKPEPAKPEAAEKEKKEAGKKKTGEKPPAATPFSARQALVEVALKERDFFSRAIANRLWAYFLGRGLVHPVDQMHSENPPSIPGLVERLGDDLAAHQYDLRRLVAGIVQSRAYQLSSRWPGGGTPPEEQHFARAMLRPLSPMQYATSIILVSGDDKLDRADDAEARRKARQELDGRARGLTKFLDAPAADFQSSVGEALYMSNHPAVQELTQPSGGNLTARLLALSSPRELVAAGIRGVHGREARADEIDFLARWFDGQPDRARATRALVWSLLTSAEFRFNH